MARFYWDGVSFKAAASRRIVLLARLPRATAPTQFASRNRERDALEAEDPLDQPLRADRLPAYLSCAVAGRNGGSHGPVAARWIASLERMHLLERRIAAGCGGRPIRVARWIASSCSSECIRSEDG